jgi:hypothetical protein
MTCYEKSFEIPEEIFDEKIHIKFRFEVAPLP